MNLKRLNYLTHRDVGYFLSGLIIIYCISGLALNHVNDWNPDHIIVKKKIRVDRVYAPGEITPEVVAKFGALVGEEDFKIRDFPTESQVKIYYDNASLLVDLKTREGEYERLSRRPVFFETNLLHRNSVKGWKWAADLFSVLLILLTLTGMFILKGKNGIWGRGKWLVIAGMVPPVLALLFFQWVQR
jgi:hypothetical protein